MRTSHWLNFLLVVACMSASNLTPLAAQAGGVCTCILNNAEPVACGPIQSQCIIPPSGNTITFDVVSEEHGVCSSPPCAEKNCSATISVVISGASSCRYSVLVGATLLASGAPTTGQDFVVNHSFSIECGQQVVFTVKLDGVCQYTQTYTCNACTH